MTTVLLVDDDESVVARNAAELIAAGFDVETATTSAGALEQVRRDLPDVVVLEGLLDGGQAGFDLARTLARTYRHLPLMMVTDADRVLSPGERALQDRDGGWIPVSRYMAKPVMPEVLASEVEHLLHEADCAAAEAR